MVVCLFFTYKALKRCKTCKDAEASSKDAHAANVAKQEENADIIEEEDADLAKEDVEEKEGGMSTVRGWSSGKIVGPSNDIKIVKYLGGGYGSVVYE